MSKKHVILPKYYRLLLFGLLLVSLGILWSLNKRVLTNAEYIPVDDFGHYWAAGKLILQGKNPYDPAMVQIERDAAIGTASEYAVVPIMWTPPWTAPLFMPFGSLPYPLGRLAWLLAMITCILICSDYLWRLYGGERRLIWLAWLCAFFFGPTISVLQKGQPSPLILAGIVGFLYFMTEPEQHTTQKDWVAGLWASLITIKPQLIYLFWPVLLLWSFKTKRWSTLAGAVTGVTVGILVTLLFNPAVISQYLAAVSGNPPSAWATPTIGGYLRLAFGQDNFWLQFVSPVLGLLGVPLFWTWKARKQAAKPWDWLENAPALLFASILTAAYSWTYDQVVLLPAIFFVLAKAVQSPKRGLIWLLVGSLMVINLADLILHHWLNEFWFGWLALAYMVWFWAGTALVQKMKRIILPA